MEKGVVKWFNNAKGYGFILSESTSQDVFAHYSSIDMNGYRTLRTGQPVLFEAISGPKGLHATAIKLVSEEEQNALPQEQKLNQETSHQASEAAYERQSL